MVRKIRDKVKDDQEFEMLLEEIQKGTSNNPPQYQHRYVYGVGNDHLPFDDESFSKIKYPCGSSPRSDFSMGSDCSSSSLVSNYPNSFCLDSTVSDSPQNLADELNLCAYLSKMHLSNQHENPSNFKNASIDKNGLPFREFSSRNGNYPFNAYKHGDCDDFNREFSDPMGVQSPFPHSPMSFDAERNRAFAGLPQDYSKMGNLFVSRPCSRRARTIHPQFNGFSGPVYSPCQRRQLTNNYHCGGNLGIERTASFNGHPLPDSLLYPRQNRMNFMEDRGISRLPDSSPFANSRSYLGVRDLPQHNFPVSNARTVPSSNLRIPQGGLDAITSEGSFIIQGEGLNYSPVRDSDFLRGQCKGAGCGISSAKHLQRSELDNQHQVLGSYSSPSARSGCSIPLVPGYNSLAETQGYIYLLAKDQHGCRFLQRVFDVGTPQDVQVIFSEIIEHVAELMMNPFGNYLMQKLLYVCNEEQRMQILLMITKEPGQLVTISLNAHGTRVIQKLIETLKTSRQQILLVVSVLEPGFLALIKDLNGNHVIQSCLEHLTIEDNKFIFASAAKYCVDIATHQHGCCVLQRCIDRAEGEHCEQLVAVVSANALLLAQDEFGNYAVQFILDKRIPSATASIILHFRGNYVNLSTQKFSSHVVEKCLAVFNNECRAQVINELLATPHFERLLQDPHANYVIQSALRHSEGHVHNNLVDKIELYRVLLRNCPYSKKIFSQKLLKK